MSKNNKITLVLLVALLFISFLVYLQHGASGLIIGINNATSRLISISPLLVAAFIFSGHIEVLLTKEKVQALFEDDKHNKFYYYALGGLLGGLMPLGPFFYYPFSAGLLKKGVPFSVVVSFLAGKRLWNFKRVAIEVIFLPPWLVFARYIITLPYPFIAGLLSDLYFRKD